MKVSQIQKEADNLLNTVFKHVLISEDKAVWRRAFDYFDEWFTKVEEKSELTDKDSHDMFVYEAARNKLSRKFGKKFIKPKGIKL